MSFQISLRSRLVENRVVQAHGLAGSAKASNTDVPDLNGNASRITDFYDEFGPAVRLSADGNTLAVGTGGADSASTGVNGDENDISEPSSGAAYLY